ncbi:MAG: chromate transporter, partial [Firmicutes bacterium]|nr:chromate transporter [Bacillota bacterium]
GVLEFSDMAPEEFANLFAISQATPGPIAVNAATFVGFKVAGVAGSAAATIGVAAPSFILVALVVKFMSMYRNNKMMDGAFKGIRPVTVGMIAAGALFIGETALLKTELAEIADFAGLLAAVDPVAVAITVVTLVLVGKFKVSAVKLILIMAAVGAVACSGMIL